MVKPQARYRISLDSQDYIETTARLTKQKNGDFIEQLVRNHMAGQEFLADVSCLKSDVQQLKESVQMLVQLLITEIQASDISETDVKSPIR